MTDSAAVVLPTASTVRAMVAVPASASTTAGGGRSGFSASGAARFAYQ